MKRHLPIRSMIASGFEAWMRSSRGCDLGNYQKMPRFLGLLPPEPPLQDNLCEAIRSFFHLREKPKQKKSSTRHCIVMRHQNYCAPCLVRARCKRAEELTLASEGTYYDVYLPGARERPCSQQQARTACSKKAYSK
ncbi:hypothetical protein GOP47_0017070, partial [Adiantum capillus-veneris]